MKLFSENANSIVRQKSNEFEKLFLDTLRLRHSTVMVNANNVYQEIIRDKQHVHMNATHWATLSDFVQYLGKMGKAKVEETERGWYIQYRPVQTIQQQEEALRRQQQAAADEQAEEAYQEKMMQLRQEQLAQIMGTSKVSEPTELEKERKEQIKVQLSSKGLQPNNNTSRSNKRKVSVFGEDDKDDDSANQADSRPAGPPPIPKTKESTKKQRVTDERDSNSKHSKINKISATADEEEPWLIKGILVRIIQKKSEYFKQKAVIDQLSDPFTAQVSLLRDESIRLSFDQRHLETVIPKEDNAKVYIVRGPDRGSKAKVVQVDKRKQRAVLRIHDRHVELDLDDFSARY
jgi:DNA/RNA-binding protein KIN17